MARSRALILVAVLAFPSLVAVMPVRALPTAAGPSLTLDVASTFTPGTPLRVRGQLLVAFGLPILVEVAQGIPDQEVEVTVDGVVAGTATTGPDGAYVLDLVLDAQPPATKMVQAVAFRGSAIETRSRQAGTTSDRILTELSVAPSSLAMIAGEDEQLLASGLWDDGRTEDLTDRVTWTSSDETVAIVENGLVTAFASGSATITASYRARAASASVTVG